MRHPILDDERNPWRETWRCAVHGHKNVEGKCSRCGLRAATLNKEVPGE